MSDKYGFTGERIKYKGLILHRIVALKDFGDVKAGDEGGCIEKEENLSQEGNCWVGYGAIVYNDAQVLDDAFVDDEAEVFGNAIIKNMACVNERAKISGQAVISEAARIAGDVEVSDGALISGFTIILGRVRFFGNLTLSGGNVRIFGD